MPLYLCECQRASCENENGLIFGLHVQGSFHSKDFFCFCYTAGHDIQIHSWVLGIKLKLSSLHVQISKYFYSLSHLPSSCLCLRQYHFVEDALELLICMPLPLKYLDVRNISPFSDLFIYVCMCVQLHIAHVLRQVCSVLLPYSLRKGLTRPEASLEDNKPHQSSCLLYSAGIIQIMLAMYVFLCIFLGFEFRFSLRHCFNLLPLFSL